MSNKIIIAEVSEKNGWMNVKTNEGKEISVLAKDGKNPVISEKLRAAKAGDELILKIVDKDGKSYGWDVSETKSGGFGGKSFAPKDKGIDIAQTCIQAAATTHSLTKDITPEKVMETAAKYMAWVNAQSTLKSQPANN